MNESQKVWWEQVLADHAELIRLRRTNGGPCHQLHYLQMVTEKLAKAYLWRSGKAPPKSHVSFVSFLKALLNRQSNDVKQIAKILGFSKKSQFESWVDSVMPLAYALERLAPALANDGPNPEYPWPYATPRHAPATFRFPIWTDLTEKAQGRRLLQIIDFAVIKFPQFC